MNHLVIYAHPNPKSFCHAILETVVRTLKHRKHFVEVRDLYALGFDPVLRASDFEALAQKKIPKEIRDEQKQIEHAEALTFIYPVWWTGMPAVMKGYIDRVFQHGFAYEFSSSGIEGLLGGRKVLLINTQGTPAGVYESSGMTNAMRSVTDVGIFHFCGMQVVEHLFYPGVPTVNDPVRKTYLAQTEKILEENF